MLECEPTSMERQALVGPARVGGEFRLVARVAEDGVPFFRKMNPDLVAAARFQPDFDVGATFETLHDFVVRDSALADVLIVRGKAIEVFVGGQQRIEGPFVLLEHTGDECCVLPLWFMSRKLVSKSLGNLLGLSHHKEPRDAPVETVGGEDSLSAGNMANVVADFRDEGVRFATD